MNMLPDQRVGARQSGCYGVQFAVLAEQLSDRGLRQEGEILAPGAAISAPVIDRDMRVSVNVVGCNDSWPVN